jgi:hypothetical protein
VRGDPFSRRARRPSYGLVRSLTRVREMLPTSPPAVAPVPPPALPGRTALSRARAALAEIQSAQPGLEVLWEQGVYLGSAHGDLEVYIRAARYGRTVYERWLEPEHLLPELTALAVALGGGLI